MRRVLLALVPALFVLTAPVHAVGAAFDSAAIDAVTRKAPLRRALWGIFVQGSDGIVLYERNAQTLMTPASVRKLFDTSAILACHGVNGVLSTRVSVTGGQREGTLQGDLVVTGTGDPSIGGRWEYDSDRDARFRPILAALRRAGIKRIDGDVVVDVSAFDDVLIPGSWKSDNLGNSWATPVDAIAFNENVIGVQVSGRKPSSAVVTLDPDFATYTIEEPCNRARHVVGIAEGNVVTVGCARKGTGSLSYLVAVDDPAMYFGQALRSFLLGAGIPVRGIRTTRERVDGSRPVVEIESPPVGMLLSTVLEESANLYAEMLLKSLSLDERPATYEGSLAIERVFLESVVGLGGDEFSFADGSGLSPENGVTPLATVRLLDYIESQPAWRHLVMDAVASPGEGTLRKRLEGLEGRVFAKTGSIDGVNALAGWVVGKNGSRRRFAIFINHHTARGKTASDAIDEIVRLVADF